MINDMMLMDRKRASVKRKEIMILSRTVSVFHNLHRVVFVFYVVDHDPALCFVVVFDCRSGLNILEGWCPWPVFRERITVVLTGYYCN